MGRLADILLFRNHRLCPRWMCFTFDNALRRLVQDPYEITGPYIKEGNRVLDLGPGIGYFTIPMARIVGDRGQVVAADIQESMLQGIRNRARRAGVRERIVLHQAEREKLGVAGRFDFILAFWMAHEVADQAGFFAELHSMLRAEGRFLLVEPKLHVSKTQFEEAATAVQRAGFRLLERPAVSLSLAALFTAD